MDELELQIKDEVFKSKVQKFYNNNKVFIFVFFFILIFTPIFFQFFYYYKEKNNEKLFSDYLKTEILFNIDKNQALKRLEDLQKSKNETIAMLANGKIIQHYLENNDLETAIKYIEIENISFKKNIFKEFKNIKEAILKFDSINENELLNLLKNNSSKLAFIKNKLLYDYYIKNDQPEKANQFMKLVD